MAYDIYFCSSSLKSQATSILSLVFHVFTFRVHLILDKAVILILKHATFLRFSKLPKLALTYAELDYQKANIDVAIQQHLGEYSSDHSVEQFVGFVMGTDIGLFSLPFFTPISYHVFSASISIEGLKYLVL